MISRFAIKYFSKRQRRRDRPRQKAHLRWLDSVAKERIESSYLACAETWGATRCPDCGIGVRAHWLGYTGHIRMGNAILSVGVMPPCEKVGKACRGEWDWEPKACQRIERRERQ